MDHTFHPTVLGWMIFLFLMMLINKTQDGHRMIYYGLVLILVFLFVANYQNVLSILVKRG